MSKSPKAPGGKGGVVFQEKQNKGEREEERRRIEKRGRDDEGGRERVELSGVNLSIGSGCEVD